MRPEARELHGPPSPNPGPVPAGGVHQDMGKTEVSKGDLSESMAYLGWKIQQKNDGKSY